MGKKIEIVDIHLDIDVEDEIRKKIAELGTDIKTQTQGVLDRAQARTQKGTKKKRELQAHIERMVKATQFLEIALTSSDPWVDGSRLVTEIGLNPTPVNLSKFALQMRKHLKTEDRWSLLNKRMSRKTYYRLERFG